MLKGHVTRKYGHVTLLLWHDTQWTRGHRYDNRHAVGRHLNKLPVCLALLPYNNIDFLILTSEIYSGMCVLWLSTKRLKMQTAITTQSMKSSVLFQQGGNTFSTKAWTHITPIKKEIEINITKTCKRQKHKSSVCLGVAVSHVERQFPVRCCWLLTLLVFHRGVHTIER